MKNQDIRTLRKDLGLSQKKFAERLGVSRRTVAYWEKGKKQPNQRKLEILTRMRENVNQENVNSEDIVNHENVNQEDVNKENMNHNKKNHQENKQKKKNNEKQENHKKIQHHTKYKENVNRDKNE